MTELNESHKWIVCLIYAVLFFIIAAPFTYMLTGKLTELIGWETSVNGAPNYGGVILHAIVFLLLTRLIMMIPMPTETVKSTSTTPRA